MDTLTHATVAELLEDLSQLLPFPTFFYTDMGAESWTPQLYFGPLDESSGLPSHRAGIDAGVTSLYGLPGKLMQRLIENSCIKPVPDSVP